MDFYKNLVFYLFLIGSFDANAQISGRVIDHSKNAIPFCNVLLTKTSDTTLVTAATTDTSGNFQLEIKDTGNFRIVATYVGYTKFYSHPFSIFKGTNQYNEGNIILESDARVLKGVQIVAEKPFIEHKVDRMVFNIENSIISSGNNALEVLNKLPGVTVDNNDVIQVRGKPGVLITIDGRTSYMSAADVGNYLKSLDASQIEKIEVITNPSAKYDASGNAVINIILKKDKNLGFNAQMNTSYSQGFYGGGSGGFNSNYRTKKINLFCSYNNIIVKRFNVLEMQSAFSKNGIPVTVFKNKSRNVYGGDYNNGRFGIDFTPNSKQTIGVLVEGDIGSGILNINDRTEMYNGSSVLDSSLHMQGVRNRRASDMTYDLNYKYKIDSTGKEFSANADYSNFSNSYREQDVTDYFGNNSQYLHAPATLKYDLPGQVTIWAAKADYVQPLGKKNKMEAGLKSSFVNTDNNAQYWNVLNGTDVPDTGKTNHFIYSENINAGYLNFSRTLNAKIETQIGLRAEQTLSKGTQAINDSTVKRNYINLFPSAFISWKLDTNHTLNFSYSRRIERPDYGELNPFLFFVNPYNYYKGNPYLQPMIFGVFQLTHVFKNFLSTSFGYMHMTDVISDIMHQNDLTHLTYKTNQNLNTYNVYNVLITATLHPVKWWTSINSANLYHDHYFGIIQEGYFSTTQITGEFNTLNSLSFTKNWSFELSGHYRTLNLDGVMKNAAFYFIDIGIKKRFANDKGTITLNCSDILWSNLQTADEVFQNLNFHSSLHMDTRRISLSLSWKLGRSQYQREEKKKSAEEEINRVKKE